MIRCPCHSAEWPSGGITWQRDDLLTVIEYRLDIVRLMEALGGDFRLDLLGSWDRDDLPAWLAEHRACNLAVFDEYGEQYLSCTAAAD
jgi:hypothetical protein